MNYSYEPNHVRVDFFKESGKWYTTEEVVWPEEYWSGNVDGAWMYIVDIFEKVVKEHCQGRLNGMWAVCLDPYHKDGYPLMIKL